MSSEVKWYQITVKQIVPTECLCAEDDAENPKGEHSIFALSKTEALDEFHATIPISCLEHFEVSIEEMQKHKNEHINEG